MIFAALIEHRNICALFSTHCGARSLPFRAFKPAGTYLAITDYDSNPTRILEHHPWLKREFW